jgi:hypothetical protein
VQALGFRAVTFQNHIISERHIKRTWVLLARAVSNYYSYAQELGFAFSSRSTTTTFYKKEKPGSSSM